MREHVFTPLRKVNARVISVTSGKGGVGKSNFTVNLAIALRRQGKRVSIIDADFGLANIEVLFGIIPRYSLGDVLSGVKTIEEVITSGPFGINFVSGGSGLIELANVSDKQIGYVLENLSALEDISDIILIDTGAGISSSVINFIKASAETIIISTPEPTSITDAYAVIKTIKEETAKDRLPDFKIVINKVDDEGEGIDIYNKLETVAQKFLGIKLTSLGFIPYDNHLVKAVKRQEPVAICYPNSQVTSAISNIALRLLNMETPGKTEDGIRGFMKRLANAFIR